MNATHNRPAWNEVTQNCLNRVWGGDLWPKACSNLEEVEDEKINKPKPCRTGHWTRTGGH